MRYSSQWDFSCTDRLFGKGIGSEAFFAAVEKELPPVFSREVAARTLGGLISSKTMCNEDSLGRGPAERVRVGRKVGYFYGLVTKENTGISKGVTVCILLNENN